MQDVIGNTNVNNNNNNNHKAVLRFVRFFGYASATWVGTFTDQARWFVFTVA